MTYLLLFFEFLKIGLFSFGGGAASLPFLFDLVDKYAWFTSAELVDMVAIAESTPGAIAVNMATYAGFNAAGIGGAAVATIGLITGPTILSLIIFKLLNKWRQNSFVNSAFDGLRPAAAGLLTAVALGLVLMAVCGSMDIFQLSSINLKALIFLIILLPLVFHFKRHVIPFIIISAVLGIVFQF